MYRIREAASADRDRTHTHTSSHSTVALLATAGVAMRSYVRVEPPLAERVCVCVAAREGEYMLMRSGVNSCAVVMQTSACCETCGLCFMCAECCVDVWLNIYQFKVSISPRIKYYMHTAPQAYATTTTTKNRPRKQCMMSILAACLCCLASAYTA